MTLHNQNSTPRSGVRPTDRPTDLGERSDAIRREEFILIQEILYYTKQLLLGGNGKQVAEPPFRQCLNVGDLRRRREEEDE